MHRILLFLIAAGATWAGTVAAAQPTPATEDEKVLYALGIVLSRNLQPFDLSAKELAMVQAGLTDGVQGREAFANPESYIPKLQELERIRAEAAARREKEAGAAYVAKAAATKGATKTASGIVFQTLVAGTGGSPTASDQVKVHYEGTLVNGTVFDSSIKRNEPATFPLGNVIPCWTEALQLMKVGGKYRIVCPSDLAYGDAGRPPPIPGGATLVFQVELLDVVKAATATPKAPAPAR